MGVPGRQSLAVSAALSNSGGRPPAILDISEWSESQLEGFRCGPDDAVLVWLDERSRTSIVRVRAFQARHAGVPALARVPRSGTGLAEEALGAGLQEVFTEVARLPESLARARARVAGTARARTEPSLVPFPDGADHGADKIFPNFFDWIYVVGIAEDSRMTFETVNAPLNAGQGLLDPDFAGKPVEECLRGTSAAPLFVHLGQVVSGGSPLQFEEEHAVAGKTRSFQTILTPVRNKWGRIHRVAGVSRDITALKEALAALRASEERLNHALEGTQQGLWDWDLATSHVYRSPRWFEMIGLAPGAITDTYDAGLKLIHPEDRRQLEAAMSAHLEGRLTRFQAEYRLKTRSGEWIWIFDAGKVVAWDAKGHPSRVAGMCTDITERRRAEEALRALVGGVVHEIRNPVYGIVINLDALEATFGHEPRYESFVGALRESAERISSLMNDLRDYGEPRTLNPEPCLVRSLVETAVRSCDSLASGKSCQVALDLEDDSLLLPLNARRMHQVFRNLLENALHHAPEGSAVSISGRRTRAEGHDWWTFSVMDEGNGFDAEALSRAFEPFFTRREGGTGLGLSIVKRVVEEHGGTVEAANRPEGGASITVRLPAPRRSTGLMEGPGA
jgi:PAS domain S-box-containing protein